MELIKPSTGEQTCQIDTETKERIEALFASSEFFNWLDKITQKKKSIYFKGDEKLYYFYEGIRLWAEKNNVYPFFELEEYDDEKVIGYACHYRVKIGNVGYEIGKIFEDEDTAEYYYCIRTEIDARFIDFDAILNSEKLEQIESRLAVYRQLAQAIESLKELGIDNSTVESEIKSLTYYIYTKDI